MKYHSSQTITDEYWEDFSKPKLIFQEIVQESQFMFDDRGIFMCNDTCRIITGSNLPFLLDVMNSRLFFYSVKTFYGGGGLGDGVRMKHTFFLNFPCIAPIQFDSTMSIDQQIFHLYGFSEEEICAIEQN